MNNENDNNIGVAQKKIPRKSIAVSLIHRDTSIGFPKTKSVFLETYG